MPDAPMQDGGSPTRALSLNGLHPFKEDEEDLWPANPWQAQADAHLLHLQRSFQPQQPQVQQVQAPTPALLMGGGNHAVFVPVHANGYLGVQPEGSLLRRIQDLEGQVAALEETSAGQERELEEAQAKLERAESSPSKSPASCSPRSDEDQIEALQRRNQFLTCLVDRFEKKTMALEEEVAGMTIGAPKSSRRHREAAVATAIKTGEAAIQTEAVSVSDLEGQLALLQEELAGKDRELHALKEQLAEEGRLRRSTEAAFEGRTPQQLVSEMEILQGKANFLQDVVTRFEDKTMVLERQAKALSASEKDAKGRLEQKENDLEQLKAGSERLRDEAESAKVALRDAKKEHNRRVQELLRQVQQLEARGKREEKEEAKELKESKDLNTQLVGKLSRERAELAQTKQELATARSERDQLEGRITGLSDQLFELSDLNDTLREQMKILRDEPRDGRK